MLANLLQGIYDTPIATMVRENGTLFPTIESIHVLSLVVVVGSIAVVDFRLLGLTSHRRSATTLIKELLPFTWVAFVIAVMTGALMFSANAISYAANWFFIAKIVTLGLAGVNMAVFHLGAYRTIGQWGDILPPPPGARIAGAASLILWTLIVVFGRWIGFTLQ